ncbi:S8 family peptidase, partial [Rhabdothermincola sp.]|uniref:S8 family peptidase n=1 Tax=Rhabdothermincola sp. TaxID=2820405 RepID=UPI002FE09871
MELRSTTQLMPRAVALAVVCTAVLATVPGTSPAAPANSMAGTDPSREGAAQVAPEVEAAVEAGGSTEVIVEFEPRAPHESPEARTERIEQIAGAAGIDRIQPLGTRRPLAVASVDRASLDALEQSGEIARVMPNRRHTLDSLTSGTSAVGSPLAWSSSITGAGQRIAILDTGVDATHPFLSGRVQKEACFSRGSTLSLLKGLCWPDATHTEGPAAAYPCASLVMDDPGAVPEACDHGTHVAGIAAGSGGPPPATSGVAPGASILAVQVFTADYSSTRCGGPVPCLATFDADLIAALDWVVGEQLASPNIAAVNMSLGGGGTSGACDTDPLKPAIDALAALGVTTVGASGNSGSKSRIVSPACISTVLAVGALDDQTGTVPAWSQSSSALDLLAPGVNIVSSLPGGSYGTWSGTSMAAPFVSGALALLQQVRGPLSPQVEEQLLKRNGAPVSDGGRTTPMLRIDWALGDQPGIGSIDSAIAGPGSISAAGWALDLDTPAAVQVQVRVDGQLRQTVTADRPRPDIGSAFPGYGSGHGWQVQVGGLAAGPRQLCVSVLNQTGSALFPGTAGSPALIGCRAVTVPGGNPFGSLDSATGG